MSEENQKEEGENESQNSQESQEEIETPELFPDSTKINYEWDSWRDINEEIETSYLDYAMSVIVSRALPDTRDGLKPVHRRILYAMHENGLRASAKYRKSAKIVWDVLWKYHPHGDSSVYEAMVRMAQDFSLRYPLVDGQGNFGSMDWDNAASMRYTEAKMTKLAEFMLADIDKQTVNFRDNYDATEKEPSVLPTRLPHLLMNGVMGIAVGMATNIPPHNLGELIEAVQYMLKVPNIEEVTIDDLMQFVKWPDFPTGGIVYDRETMLQAYSTGRGSVVMRWVATIEENKKWRQIINISEIPYGLNKASLVTKIADLVNEKKIIGISDIRDESNREWVRVIIELKKDSFPKKVLNQLYQLTPLQTSFGYNMISLGEKWMQPKLYNLKEILEDFIDHRKEVITRRTQYELGVAEARAHILEGLKKALDHIDEIIATIRASETKDDARDNLIAKFAFSDLQTDAILEMKLQRLAGLERQKIEDELTEKMLLIADLKDILVKPERIINIIIEELDYIKENFWDDRRTKIMQWKVGEFSAKDTIPNEEIVVVLTKNNYLKRLKASSFRVQRRGWVGITTATKEDDEIKLLLSSKNHNDLLFFTSRGRVFTLPAYEIPETTRIAKGQPAINMISLQKDEEVAAVLDITEEKNKYLFFVTSEGTVKKLAMDDVKNIRSSGLIVLKIKEWESLTWVKTTSGDDNIMIATYEWKAIQFSEADVRPMGRAASWVRWIRLKGNDQVVEVAVVWKDAKYLLVVTEKWMGKISEIEDYRDQSRGGSWVKAMAVTPKTGKLIGATTISQEEKDKSNLILISRDGQTIKLALNTIRVTGRVTQGVILTKIRGEADSLMTASVVRQTEEEGEEEASLES
jgi:DNA gyrase subunit A